MNTCLCLQYYDFKICLPITDRFKIEPRDSNFFSLYFNFCKIYKIFLNYFEIFSGIDFFVSIKKVSFRQRFKKRLVVYLKRFTTELNIKTLTEKEAWKRVINKSLQTLLKIVSKLNPYALMSFYVFLNRGHKKSQEVQNNSTKIEIKIISTDIFLEFIFWLIFFIYNKLRFV